MHRKRASEGFTLVELLVVIAIVFLLAALLFPAFHMAKEHAHQLRCLGNLTQLTRAVHLYAADYGCKPPNPAGSTPESDWYGGTYGGFIWVNRGQLWPYVKNADVYLCPKDWRATAWDAYYVALEKQRPDVAEWAKHDFPISYAMNASLGNRILDTVRRQREVMLMIHEGRRTINDGAYAVDRPWDKASEVHYNGTTIVYLDCHAVWRTKEELDGEKARGLWLPNK